MDSLASLEPYGRKVNGPIALTLSNQAISRAIIEKKKRRRKG
jgi:hypothetical protein